MKRIFQGIIFGLIFTVVFLCLYACSGTPCADSAKDTRPLTAEWDRLIGPIDKSEMCYSEVLAGGDNERYLDFVSLNPEQTYRHVEKSLMDNGWKGIAASSGQGDYTLVMLKEGYQLDVQVTQDLDTGWARMQLTGH